ncbi:rihA [Symbiodinium natans]|uniref:RihA protein n=1 Tax=Symbiodinium natans TaxID=878477 RepID=A0A812HZX5_9DINO|nr:rihA [Symbiodinium natans]
MGRFVQFLWSSLACGVACVASEDCAGADCSDASAVLQHKTKAKGRSTHSHGGRECSKPYPFIWDNDANYDDTLALLYLAHSENLDWKAITIESDGMGTPHGGPTNIAAAASLVGLGDVPIAMGGLSSLSPIATMPLQWRLETDEFFERMFRGGILDETDRAIVDLTAAQLIVKILNESACPVVILTTGPATNVAEALDMDPSIAGNIHGIYMMGSAYGVPGTNNVYDWQMTYNGVKGSCTEDGGQTYTGLSPPLNRSGVVSAIRPECRGVDMTAHGDTEWNVFMDVRAWHMVYGFLKDLPADHVYVLAANATLNMPVTLEEMEEYAATLADPGLRIFVTELAKAFLAAGEAKWWDAQCAVVMDQVLSGLKQGVCSNWFEDKLTSVSLVWRSNLTDGELNPYGSVYDDEDAHAPPIDYCLDGNVTQMWEVYWPMVNQTG